MRFLSTIQAYVPDIQYIEGAKNVVGDALSRALYQLRKGKANLDCTPTEIPIMDAATLALANNMRLVQTSAVQRYHDVTRGTV